VNTTYAEVIGDPIHHSKSPLIHNFWLGKLGIDAEYRTAHVRADGLAAYFAKRRSDPDWRGCNVTIPHKEAALAHLDRRDERVLKVGAVNTVWPEMDGRLAGTNTDVDGVGMAIRSAPSAGHAVVIGAGGAARAAYAKLAEERRPGTIILARSPEKAQAAADDCGLDARILPFEAGSGAIDGASLLINATQLGMDGQERMPAFILEDLTSMAEGGLVFDMVYAPLETDLLRAAAEAGLDRSDGLVMLVGQAATAFEAFFGARPPREFDGELRELLIA